MLASHISKLRFRPRMQDIVVSVVIPTRGRPALLTRCLNALCVQTLDPRSYEIIVVDDGPDGTTCRTVEACAARIAPRGLAVRYIASHGPHGPAAARNRGWRQARGEIIAFTDDDTDPAEDWLSAGIAAFDRVTDALAGRIVVPIPPAPTDYELDVAGLSRAEFATANVFCRKSVLERIDGFDERFPLAWREDSDLQFSLLRAGATIKRADTAMVLHPVRHAGWGVSLAQQKKVMFDVLLYRKHPALYRARIRRAARWDYYTIVAALLTTVFALIFGVPQLAVAAAAVWSAMTLWFCVQRLRRTTRDVRHVAEMMVTSALIPPVAVFWRLVGAIRYRAWLA